ncbi:hypothetical protein DDZ13_11355 [Coraliomargarita sinensis]|uniref:Uncharacterized protein n=1 Tax=Coraliomargarita sinensis TaxID=2174842 RepID=A0A317ZED3_9BACT|nr:hypothetical protein [Coraliomargarita sinensis]PXA03570.1 hypothetical protein DDZ13_11355 [Coraliomargarita sinensis]
MNASRSKSRLENSQTSGFALIASITIMAVLVLVGVTLYSLSSVATKSADIAAARTEAQANAKTALMMAIGDLQKHTGPDTRITAPADIYISSNDIPNTPKLVGAWRSWEGLNHDPSTGRPIAPDYTLKVQNSATGNGRFISWLISSATEGQNVDSPETLAYTTPTKVNNADTVPLLTAGDLNVDDDGSLPDSDNNNNPREIHVLPNETEDGGGYAWWVSPENQKARLKQSYEPRTQDEAGWSDLAKSHSVPDPSVFGLSDEILDDPEAYDLDGNSSRIARKALNLSSVDLLKDDNAAQPHLGFHDFSVTATGLLTNTATGGWRKDMSILTEKWDDIYSNYADAELPLFRYSPAPGDTSAVPKPTESNYDPDQSVLYPWSDYTQIGANKIPSTYHTASASWQSLVNFATYYKKITYDSGSKIGKAPFGWRPLINGNNGTGGVDEEDFYQHYHEQDINPVVARVQVIVQANTIPDPNPNEEEPRKNFRINLNAIPYVTLWNPYNVEINKSEPYVQDRWAESKNADIGVSTQRSLPITMGIINGTVPPPGEFSGTYKLFNGGNQGTIDGVTESYDYNIQENIDLGYGTGSGFGTRSQYYGIRAVTAWLPLEFNLKPGEVKIYSPAFGRDGAWSGGVRLKEGLNAGDDAGLTVHPPNLIDPEDNNTWKHLHKVQGRPRQELHSTDLVRFSLKTDRFTKPYSNQVLSTPGAGAYFQVGTPFYPRSLSDINNGEVAKGATLVRTNMVANPDWDWARKYWPSDELQEVSYYVNELEDDGDNPPWTNIFSISFGPRLTIGAGYGNTQGRPTKGVLQSSPFAENTFSTPEEETPFHPGNTAYDLSYSSMAKDSPLSPEVGTKGYIISGFQSGEGLSRLVMAEIPLKPMASLVELQSWNVRGKNPLPPFQYNLIGNSDATPLIQQNSVLPSDPYLTNVATNLQHDDAYCANHLLFDDWVFSSIAPLPTNFGSDISKDIETVYEEFLEGDFQLTNRAYQPIPEDRDLSAEDASALADSIINSPDGDGWQKIASRLVVDGMFNVNSTSIEAWRALLGHAREQEVAHHTENGMTLDSTKRDHVVSRHTVAADVEAGNNLGMGAEFPYGSEYSGFRTLSDDQLYELARLIVEQIRVRGPFLSLSEFINRQLSTTTLDLPLAGNEVNLALAGALQTALDRLSDDPLSALKNEGVNDQLSSETMDPSDSKLEDVGYAFEQAAEGFSTHGLPGWIRQADILRPLAPVLSARDDTFTIRAYGDKRDAAGNVIARAWCEATVQRSREYVDPVDEADFIDTPTSEKNRLFGRKYTIKSFRWLDEDEV